ncbi:PadR family transcriptional regulator [Peribacillus frigoritolerans]|uniref:PadR family transcriptional regulator n=1 Tax=Peribacillus frigoritolerans TaxID=450367 RepID=UPI003DA090D0
MDKELMKGSIDLLLLSLLSQKKLYGYEITKILKEMSMGKYQISEGTLYSALKRLEKKEFIKGHWKSPSQAAGNIIMSPKMDKQNLNGSENAFSSSKN